MGNIARLADDAGDAVRRTIRAWHGSPLPVHFDRFDSSKIGSGEGHQAYGYGMYFAGHPGVASAYRRNLSKRSLADRFDELGLPQDADPEDVVGAIEEFDPRQQELLRRLSEADWLGFDYPSQAINESLKESLPYNYEIDPALLRARDRVGTAYQVEIDAPEASLLDWDSPLAKQSSRVRSVLGDFANHVDDATGEEAYREMARALGGGHGNAARALRNHGVPGIRYLDGFSRRFGAGTRNYVMFPGTEDKIRILSKYAVPPLVAAGMQGEDR